ncbi:MAG: YjbH domain-containing protein, partial [Burkholderiaceae bacterium]
LWSESRWLPELAVGVRDLGGTALFGSEYLVASKRWGRFDASLGLGWGLLGGRGNVSNPMAGLFGQGFNVRDTAAGVPGEVNNNKMFHGRTALFGGVEYQSPWGPTFKLEYDGNNYRHEPYGNVLAQRSPLNFGLVHRLMPGLDLSLGYERGNTFSVGLTLWADLARTHTTKLADAQAPRLTLARPPRGHVPDWQRTRDDVQALADWRVERLVRDADRLVLEVSDSDAPYRQPRLDKVFSVLHRDAPADVQRFEVHHRQAGEVLAVQSQDRDAWLRPGVQPQRTTEPAPQAQLSFARPDAALAQAPSLVPPPRNVPQVWPSLSFLQSLGGPDAFMLYQLSAVLNGHWRLPGDVQLAGRMQARLLSNYDKFDFAGFSSLPRVRTHVREYLTNSPVTMSNLY